MMRPFQAAALRPQRHGRVPNGGLTRSGRKDSQK
jgi:hypothetical protein